MLKPFFIRTKGKLKKINPMDVVGLTTEKNYTKIFLTGKIFYMVRSTMSSALKKLPRDMFIRIHRSHAISIYHIDVIERDYLQTVDDGIPIGKQYYQSLISKLNIIE